jgi:AraC family transcriptional regulator
MTVHGHNFTTPPRPESLADYRRRIRVVQDHIASHPDAEPDLAALARLAHFSPYHFHRVFRGITGLPVAAYVRTLRLERAAHDLAETRDSVLSIALRCGYESHEAFTRAFGDVYGMTPSRYRRIDPACRPSRRAPTEPHLTGEPPMDVNIVTLEPIRVISLRHVGPYGSPTLAGTWSRLCGWAGPRGLLNAQTRCFGIGHDDPECTPPAQIRYDACLTVGPGVQGEGDIQVQTIKGGRYACTRHIGPYQNLAKTYGALFGQWLPASGHEPAEAPSVEQYMNSPDSTPPEKLITDIYVPLK